MENRKFVAVISGITLGVLMSTPSFSYGYSVSTHANLTEKTFAEYERIYGDTFTDEEVDRAKQGSMDEDTFESKRRPLNHFYDPINDVGLRAHGMLSIPNITRGLAAPVWATDTEAQANFLKERIGYSDPLFSSPTDFSWDRAVYEYVHGDRKRAVKTLGHIIHLVQDATSPAHVRNDAHLMGDVYETFTTGMRPGDWHIEESDIPQDNSIQSIVKRTALFTNKNFLSRDTIFENYEHPNRKNVNLTRVSQSGKDDFFGVKDGLHLVRIKIKRNWIQNENEETYFLKDDDSTVLTDYWETLSKRAVRDGVAAIKVFFQAVEKEQETLALQDKNKSAAEKNFDSSQATLFGIAKSLYGSSVDKETFEELNPDAAGQGAAVVSADVSGDSEIAGAQESSGEPVEDEREESGERDEGNETRQVRIEQEEGGETEREDTTTSGDSKEDSVDDTNANPLYSDGPFSEGIPIQGVGGGFSPQEESGEDQSGEESESKNKDEPKEESEEKNDQEKQEDESPNADESKELEDDEEKQDNGEEENDTTSPDPPTVTTPAATSSVFTSTTIQFAGTAEATSTISTDISHATTSTDKNGNWLLTVNDLPQGTSTVKFFATDEVGNTSAPTSTTLSIDSKVPTPTLFVIQCDQSLSTSGCLVATTTISIQWSSAADDVEKFLIDTGSGIATTTATSTKITTDNPDDLSISVRAIDRAGNVSAPISKMVSVRSNPVVINEVAWMGTHASAFDEWIELYNPTDTDISLKNWMLHASDGSLYIPLSGTIDAGGYYIIERTDDTVLASTTADLVVPFSGLDGSAGLSNSGQQLMLSRFDSVDSATTTIDKTPDCSNWCGDGDKSRYRTMERYNPHASGASRENWGTALGEFIKNGKDADGNDINGTPGKRNSISYKITNGDTLKEDKILTNEHPYLIERNGLTIEEGTTLTAEEGVVVKFVSANEPSLVVNGTLQANGTKANPVVFTAFKDDTYGGDMNGDGDATSPTPGGWKKILFTDISENSSLTHTMVRYGGRWFRNTNMKASVAVDNTDVSFDHVTIAHPKRNGLYLRVSSSTIAHSTFTHATSSSHAAGVRINGGAPRIIDSTFSENKYGLRISNAPEADIQSNTFTNNKTVAIHVRDSVPSMSGNTGSGNTLNAITIGHNGDIAKPNSTTRLKANHLPYLIVSESEVPADATLTFESGVVVKAHDDNKNNLGNITVSDGGRIFYDGSDSTDVVFTSMHDDAVGASVNIDNKSPRPGDWEGIVVEDGGSFSVSGFTLRYAGQERGRSQADGLYIETGSGTTTIAHAVIERNKQFGILAKENAALDIVDTKIKNHPEDSDVAHNRIGLLLLDSNATLSEVLFSNNETDIEAVRDSAVVCDTCESLITEPADLFD